MKLTILAIGSRGDVQPCVALGRGLADAGHTVRVVTLENFEGLVRGQGLDFFPVEGNAQELTAALVQGMGRQGLNLLVMARSVMRTFGAISERYITAFADPVLRDSQAVLCQLPGGFFGYDLAEHLQVPYIGLSVIPQETTGAWPLSLLPVRRSLGRAYNRWTHGLGRQLAWRPFRGPINRFRRRLGLPPAPFWEGNLPRMRREGVPVLQGFSEHVVPKQPEWGDSVHTTGYWTLAEAGWQPGPALESFLEAGDPPVFIGFGSMSVSEPGQTTALILDALKRCGRRGVIGAGWANLRAAGLPDSVFLLDYAPYTWLFPRMSAVIHHGGSGTTGLALGSGVPSMAVPFTADQPFWGDRTHALGVGPPPIPFSRLTPGRLARAIRAMTANGEMQARAIELRRKMAGEAGVARAVEIVRRLLSR